MESPIFELTEVLVKPQTRLQNSNDFKLPGRETMFNWNYLLTEAERVCVRAGVYGGKESP